LILKVLDVKYKHLRKKYMMSVNASRNFDSVLTN
jgi:hypothetical protein